MATKRQAPSSRPGQEPASHAPPAGALREPMQSSRDSADDERVRFLESMQQRGEAANGLRDDLLTEVPLLYGSPGISVTEGDPGIALAKIHRDGLVRRHGGSAAHLRGKAPARLPFERAMLWFSVLLLAVLVFGS